MFNPIKTSTNKFLHLEHNKVLVPWKKGSLASLEEKLKKFCSQKKKRERTNKITKINENRTYLRHVFSLKIFTGDVSASH